MNRTITWGVVTMIICLIYLGVTVAEEKPDGKEYNLVYHVESGQKRQCAYELSVAGEVKVVTFGRHPVMRFSSKIARTINEQILEAKKDPDGNINNLKMKREYASSVLTALEPVKPGDNAAMEPGPEKKNENTRPDAIDKQTLEISYQDGNVNIKPASAAGTKGGSKPKDELSPEAQALVTLHDGNFALFAPNKKVKIGDEWEIKSDVISQVLALKDGRPIRYVHKSPEVGMRFDIQDNSVIKCAFTEVVKIDGVDCAKIKLEGQIAARQDDILNAQIAVNGFTWLALKDGAAKKVELDGDMKLSGEYPGHETDKGMALRCIVEGKGRMSLKTK
ncbi:MAG: hypothetical protein HZA49_01055 [Planctomycetes bacterium]|nr:hypothetical protein [Planctomycetota bacterium]